MQGRAINIFRLTATIFLAGLFFSAVPASLPVRQSALRISTLEQIEEDFASVPCDNKKRLDGVRAMFEKMGASPSEITLDKHKNVENLFVLKKGASEEKIVIGAHYDKVSQGCGAVDNWTGIVALTHLYRTLKGVPLKRTVLFVAFGREEDGLFGSGAMVKAIGKDQIPLYCAMVNVDSLGLAAPQVADNMSSKKLLELAAELAEEMKMPFAHASIPEGTSDSVSFMAKKIPALTIHGLSNYWNKILHSKNDQPSKVIPYSVYLGYRLALALVSRIDRAACDAYR
ncbi:MAG: M28 family metallopeptidase [Blastocatellia bacterium]|nr:M28 family metallopeptidase [Blastocatellia bacterium]